jgi:SAM-dependent methyltransferase
MDRVKKSVGDVPENTLDVGGGRAPYVDSLHERGTYEVMEPECPDGLPDKVRWIGADAHDIGATDKKYGLVLSFMVLEHTKDPWLVMRNMAEWLEDDGVIVISVPQYWRIHGHPGDYHRFTIQGVRNLVEQAGLRIDDHWALGGPFVLVWTAFELASAPLLRLPLLSQLIGTPTLFLARLLDKIFHRGEVRDTVGWMAVMRKVK